MLRLTCKFLCLKILKAATYIFVSIGMFGFSSHGVFADPILIFNASVGEPFSNAENTGFEDRLVIEIFRRLGKKVKIHFAPAERALRNLNEGIDDGALGRVGGILKKYANIRQIPEKAFDRDFTIYTRTVALKPKGWDSLSPYNVGIITGWKILEINIKNSKSLVKVKDGRHLFQLLNQNRVDLVIYNRWGGLQLLRNMNLNNFKLLEPPLVRAPHFFNLNKKHEALIGPAAKALRDMKNDGTYQKIFNATLAPLASN